MIFICNKGGLFLGPFKERTTKQKCCILNCLKNNAEKHLTVENICSLLEGEGFGVGTATVYRCVKTLVKEGVLKKYKVDSSNRACYQYINKSQNCDEHCHLVCLNCEKVLHFESKDIKKLQDVIKEKEGFLLDISGTSFYGLCSSCNK